MKPVRRSDERHVDAGRNEGLLASAVRRDATTVVDP